jgi:hypothetical protein
MPIGMFRRSKSRSVEIKLLKSCTLKEMRLAVFLGRKGGRHVRLKTSPPSVS